MHSAVRTIYFDYNATTPLDPTVREAMLPYLGDIYGNPSSIHHVGRRARALLDEARDHFAATLHCKTNELIFTSGGSESVNLAIFGAARMLAAKGKHLITSAAEHHAVLHAFRYLAEKEHFDVTYVPVDGTGVLSPEAVARAFRPDTTLVSLMAANNETGVLQPAAVIGRLCRERGVIFHTDAVQWFGKEPFSAMDQFQADLVSICAHKFHGPKGAGALYVRSPLKIDPIIFGGSHEDERRAGTENLTGIIGLVEAARLFIDPPVFQRDFLAPLVASVEKVIRSIPGAQVVAAASARLPNTVAMTVEGTDSLALLAGLDLEGVCASSGSACSSGSLEPSHVLLAMGYSPALASSLVRFSLGRDSTAEDAAVLAELLPSIGSRARRG